MLQMWCQGDREVGVDVNQQQLIGKMVSKVFQVRKGSSDFCKVADCHRPFDTEHIGFKEDSFLLEPCKKVSVGASKFDVAEAAVRKDMTSDADLRLVLTLNAGGRHFKILFEFGFSFWDRGCREHDLIVVAWCA